MSRESRPPAVDFDNSLNTSINKLREALGDSADSPRFIETVPRRGYRFVAPVKGDTEKKREAVGHAQGFRGWRTGVVAAAVVIVVTVGLLWRSRQPRRLTQKDTIVLGDFANSTGDAVFDGTLREGLSVELEQSPFLSLLSEEGIHHTLRMMGQAANARLTPEIAQEVCQRTSSVAALQGSIALIGSRYNLILKAVQLCQRRFAGDHRRAGERQEPRSRCAGEGCLGNAEETGRVFEHGTKIQHTSRAGDYSIS